MIDTPTTANLQDFKQRYSGVLGWYISEEDKSKILVTVSNVSNERVTFRDQHGGTYYAFVNGGVRFEFLPVEKSWRNTEDACFFLYRIPARQWKRGICADNTSITSASTLLGMWNTDGERTWADRIFKIFSFNNTYREEVLKFLEGKRTTVAISPHFAILSNHIFLHNINIGTYKNNVITLTDGMLLQELTDTIRRMGITNLKVTTK